MPYLVLGIALLAGVLLLARWMTTADPRVLAWVARVAVALFGLAAIALVAYSGRYTWIIYALPFLLPVLFQWRSNRIRARNAAGPTPGQSSEVTTRYLRMTLDHDSGDMSGTVMGGPYAGRALSAMNLVELMDLLQGCSDDEDSVRVLEAYLDRVHGPDWRGGDTADAGDQEPNRKSAGRGNAMTVKEALDILGLEPGAGPDEIKEAHRRLMAKLHPDQGGTNFLASKLNQAKDLLLNS